MQIKMRVSMPYLILVIITTSLTLDLMRHMLTRARPPPCIEKRNQNIGLSWYIGEYLRGRRENLSNDEIAARVFHVNLKTSPQNPRHSFPLVTASTMEAYADVAYTFDFYYKMIKWPKDKAHRNGDVIYVRDELLYQFAKNVFPRLQTKFILVSLTGDGAQPRDRATFSMLEDNRLLAWFARNAKMQHRKLHPMAIGFNSANNITYSYPHQPELMLPVAE